MWRPPQWGAAEGGACVCDYFIFYIINIYGYISHTFLIYSIYIFRIPYIGGWGCESNREIIGFLCCEWVRETMCFLSLGRAAPTCAPPPAPSLVFPCVFSVNPVFVVFDQWSHVNPMSIQCGPFPPPPILLISRRLVLSVYIYIYIYMSVLILFHFGDALYI